MFDTLSVSEVVDPIVTGMTEPYRCRLSDDNLYAVKGRQALVRGLIAEVLCAQLASKIGIPTPPFAIAKVDTALVAATADRAFERSIGPGYGFASLWIEPATPLMRSTTRSLDSRLLATIYAFDHWIKNGDRSLTEHGGNPNLLIDLQSNNLLAIDHNLAFSESYDPSELLVHAGHDAWLDERQNLVFKDECGQKFDAAAAAVDQIIDNLPYDWLEQENELIGVIQDCLKRHSDRRFWDEMG